VLTVVLCDDGGGAVYADPTLGYPSGITSSTVVSWVSQYMLSSVACRPS